MNNFKFHNPTKIIFGEDTITAISGEIPSNNKILLTFGSGSIKANGVYDQVTKALSNHTVIEFGGIEPNPEYSTLMKAVEICRAENVEFILSVGGGSVLDGSKFIAAAVYFSGDPWQILQKNAKVKKAIPLGAILTLPATGSEMNAFAVISRKETGQKLAFGSPNTFPKFSVLDPTTTRSLSPTQRGNGVVDAFIHVTEQYLTYHQNSPLQDRMAEAILLTLIEEGPKYYSNPEDMDSAKNVMWCATMALNGMISAGLIPDWAVHSIGHELTALYDIDHARTLAIVWPGMMRVMKEEKQDKLLQYAKRIWNIVDGTDDEIIEQAISKTETFFNSVGLPTKLVDYGLDNGAIDGVIENLVNNNFTALGEQKLVTPEKARLILENRL